MTVSYASSVATVRHGSLVRLLARWHGSVYQAVWPTFLLFCFAYGGIALIYYLLPTDTPERLEMKQQFVQVCAYAARISNAIPVSFVLGFFVNLVVSRWWKQFLSLPTPDSACYLMGTYLRGCEHKEDYYMSDQCDSERPLLIRRSVARYLNLASALCFQEISLSMKRQVGTLEDLVDCGLMTKQEETIFLNLSQDNGHFFIPVVWAVTLLSRAHHEGLIKHERHLDAIVAEVVAFWRQLHILFLHDYVNVPLVYNQVVTLVVYVYLGVLVLSHQFSDPVRMLKEFNAAQHSFNGTVNRTVLVNGTHPSPASAALDVAPNVPVFALLALMFYTGWLRVAESSVFPFAEDDDNFEVIPLLERNIGTSMWFVDSAVTDQRNIPEIVKTGCKPPGSTESGDLPDGLSQQPVMGLKRSMPPPIQKVVPDTHRASTSVGVLADQDLPCPTELRRRESKYFFAGSMARICEEQKDNRRYRRFSRPTLNADPNVISVDSDDEVTFPSPRRPSTSIGTFFRRIGARVSQAFHPQPSSYSVTSSVTVEDPVVTFQKATGTSSSQSQTISSLGTKAKYV
ncbi:hypothetical protein CRM22_007187 [Opisthorchis felineus]|uniref:Bestrophin homolog n=1 Tax=Opisthorchis felineus TaxID=147828 RepID=A0A4S2LQD6_OPIFE|nr:hypothetical protein CRM22_007187 [Opisthorchis felineus]